MEHNGFADVPGFDGRYKINSEAVILSFNKRSNGKVKKPKMSWMGYWIIQFNMDGKKFTKSIHRLLAESFLPNPNNLRCVNHINGIKTDNRLENLEWCSDKENTRHYHHTLMGRTNTRLFKSLHMADNR